MTPVVLIVFMFLDWANTIRSTDVDWDNVDSTQSVSNVAPDPPVTPNDLQKSPRTPMKLWLSPNAVTLNLLQRSRERRQKAKARAQKLKLSSFNVQSDSLPDRSWITSPSIQRNGSSEEITYLNPENLGFITSGNESNEDVLKQEQKELKADNRTTVTLYGLIASQRSLHKELQHHLLSTRNPDLFISMIKVSASPHRPQITTKTYWTHHNRLLGSLTEILTSPQQWFDVEKIKEMMRDVFKYFALWTDQEKVNNMMSWMDERYWNKSDHHRELCQDVRYSILVFRKVHQRVLNAQNDGTTFHVKLRITVDTMDLVIHWWQITLSVIARKINNELRFLLEESECARHHFLTTNNTQLSHAMKYFNNICGDIEPNIERYALYVTGALNGGKTKMEFLIKAGEMGNSIHSDVEIIAAMSIHWLIATQCFDWMRQGNEGQIMIILPCEESLALMHMLLIDLGIPEEDQTMIRVEEMMIVQHAQCKRAKKGKAKKSKVREISTFQMTEILPCDLTAD